MRAAVPLLTLGLSLTPPATAQTDGVQVTPVIVAMAPERGVTSVRVRNWRERETSFEVTVLAWEQRDGADLYTQTDLVVAAPSVFAIPAGAEQIVRLGLTHGPGAAPDQEIAYRLLLRELPSPDRGGAGPRMQLQMSLPVFVQPRATHVEIAAQRVADDTALPSIVIANTGSAHIRLGSVTYGPNDEPIERLPRYLLAGSRVTRSLPQGVTAVEVTYVGPGAAAPVTTALRIDAHAPQPHVR